MARVRVSSKYQVVIPREERKRLGIERGQFVNIFSIGSRLVVVPDVDISEMAGAIPGLTSEGIRDEEDRF